MASVEPFDALIDMALKSVNNAFGLPAVIEAREEWSGVGFMLGNQRMVAPMGEIAELLEVTHSTRLPGVQSWVRGVSNVRGRLLPMIDLEAFFGGTLTGSRKRQRVLALDMGELYTGLLVKEVYGMQHFAVDTFTKELPDDFPDAIKPFVSGTYRSDMDESWVVFSPYRLARDQYFFNAAVN
jgi:twitching motility protein PilI